jgi:hypothetical protein
MPLSAQIDGADITDICQQITWSPRLNLIESGTVRIPSGFQGYAVGDSDLHLYEGGTLKFTGTLWNAQPEGGVDASYTELTAYDHRIYLTKRQCKALSAHPAGDLITPGSVILEKITAPEIMAAYIANSFAIDGLMPLTVGEIDAGGPDVTGVPMDFPMTIDRMRALLTSTGQLDQVLHPAIGNSTVDFLNDYTNDVSGSVLFEYATGSHNCQVATLTVNMDEVVNALWYLLGPRRTKQRWAGSITPTAPYADPDGPGPLPGPAWPADLLTRIAASRAAYGYFQEIRIFDDEGDEQDIRPLFVEEWANEAWVRAVPRTFASVRPERGITPSFRVGDTIGVAAGSILDGGFSGTQTVYGFDWTCDADGVDEIAELITSHDQAGATGAGG